MNGVRTVQTNDTREVFYAADVSDTLSVDASASSDAETPSGELEFRWDWESDGTYDTTFDTTPTATHQFLAAGSFTIRVLVRDSDAQTATATRSVTITRAVATVEVSPGSASVGNGFEQQFTATAKDGNGTAFGASKTWSVSPGTLGTISSSGLFTAGTAAGSGWVIATSESVKDSSAVTVTAQAISYASDLAASFSGTCAQSGCHDGNHSTGLDLRTYSGLRGSSTHGPVVIPGDPAGSVIIQKLSSSPPFGSQMPLAGSVTQSWKNKLYVWIAQGASDNAPPPR